eukprot:TRINITY_DN59262_c0_g1_i1.p1 TRINITY_DN59262_c0_g1~~TRINITY_DN59262_c0_g1_i1.p1  ORF type:complete len:374 (+),score=69.47 TRINITY_DN59262_c0_g1_i1:45-1124(+)
MVVKCLAACVWAVCSHAGFCERPRGDAVQSLRLDHGERPSKAGTQIQDGMEHTPSSSGKRLHRAGLPSVAIVMLTRNPPDLLTWLRYHIVHMGIQHVFIKSEAALPGASLVAQLGTLISRVTLQEGVLLERPRDNYTTLQHRQLDFIKFAQQACKEQGIDWLVHIDDDELLYSAQGRPLSEVLAVVPPEYGQVVFQNKEAVYDSAKVENCFRETTRMNLNARAFVSYANGKPGLRVSVEDAQISGPHRWTIGGGKKTFQVDTGQVILIHYESCPFSRWKDKMWHLSNTSPEALKKIVFPFYRESIKRMQECHMSGMEGDHACSDTELERFWAEHKTAAGRSNLEISPIRIPWDKVLSSP